MDKLEIKAIFTEFKKGENWTSGFVSDGINAYEFSAKLFDTGSTSGINNGRVSKLGIFDKSQTQSFFVDEWFMNYDRGWDRKPSKEFKPYYNCVMELLENAPTYRFEVPNDNQ